METSFWRSLWRTKPVDEIVREGGGGEGGELKRSMTLIQLTFFSVGATLGTGIFVVMGEATPLAGPAVVLAFLLSAITALFSALSYAELAGTIPVSGSSYSYTYATMGELVAWVCGWCLILEYGVSVSAVAVGWAQYLNDFLDKAFGVKIPDAWSQAPDKGGVINITAVLIVAAMTFLLMRGASESAKVNTAMVFFKLGLLIFFIVVGFTGFNSGNLSPFMPLGFAGVSAAASQVFFSYIGFDAASTAGEEAKNPKRDLPLAIILSLAIVTIVYVLVALVAVGALPWTELDSDTEASLSAILTDVTGATWPALLLSAGAVIAITSVVLTVLYGQTRILFAMSRDGLVPPLFQKINRRTSVPVANTLVVGGFVSLLAALVPLDHLTDATSIGTLFAFALVNLGVIVLRRTKPHLPRSFKTPLYPLTPLLGVFFCLYVMQGLRPVTWLVFALWTLAGLVFYFGYSRRHSRLLRAQREMR
ncbi:amino acid/polyamine/organocation transporter (APC superfamily) [Actinocorallia herbida]|uniref:Amino acid/polyamine/organocation transporter (APC superfamily) n=1 Tax=Actinocorallia herbida TaxID=58109 RepID=A0A3N1CS80_9ACTN|nr:amino acid permease [Actinocorallia herbida]ROO84172.1 amino acid/polyamine/organocation transporter (APC superfamily) [Actinocorallia herbida]